jgi:hypothetical protein
MLSSRVSLAFAFAASASLFVATTASAQTKVTVKYTTPSADRWNYPFNPTPGIRPTSSVFGNEAGSSLFDNRDGQMIVVYNTAEDIPRAQRPRDPRVRD